MAHLFLGYGATTENLDFVANAIRCSGSDPADSSNIKTTSSSTTSTSTYLDSVLECHQIYSDKQCCYHQDGEKYFHNYRIPMSDDGSIESDDDVAIEDRNNKKLIAISQSKEAIKMKSLLQHDDGETITPEARMLFQACIRELVLDDHIPLNAKESPASADSDYFHSDPWWKKLVSEFQTKAKHPLPSKRSNERKKVKPIAKDGNAQELQSKDVVGSIFRSNKRPVGRLPDKHVASSGCSDKKETIVATRGEGKATASTNTNTKSSYDAIGLDTFRDKFTTFIEKVVHIVDPFTGKPIEEVYDGVHSGRILGKGISGNVRLIKHRTTGTKHANKCIDLELFDDGDKRCMKQLEEEIKILCELDHPNIVRLESVYVSHQNIYLVQELCLGGELFDRLDKQIDFCFSEGVCARLVKQMLSAVRYLHDKGIIHRDLKLENFLLSSNDPTDCNIKLIDFGSSRHFRQGDIYDDAVGTPYTVAPEVISKCYDEKCDIWSIGVIAFLLLCGDAPFGGCGGPEPLSIVRANILSENYAFEPHETWDLITDDCKDFIEDMLNVDPIYRPSAQQAQQHPWFKYWAAKRHNTTTNTNINDTGLKPDVIQNLINFKECSPLRRLLSEVLSFTLMPEQLADLRKEFEKIDTDGSGEIDFTTLMEALLTTNGKISRSKEFAGRALLRENDVGAIFDAMRVNKTEPKIRWHELVAAAFPPCQVDDRNFRHAFERLDSDNKGFVTFDDILDLVGSDERQNEEQLEPMWKESMKAINCNQQRIFYHQFLLLMKGQPEKQVENRLLNSPNASERKSCSSLTVVTETKSSNFKAQYDPKQLNYSLEAPLSEDGDDVFLNSLPNIGIKDNASAKSEPPEKTLKVNANDHDEMKAASPMIDRGSDDSVKTDLIFDSSKTWKPTEESIAEVNTTETCPSDQDDKSTYGASDNDIRNVNRLVEGSELLVESCETSSLEPIGEMNNNAIDPTRKPSTSPVISDLSISVYQEPDEEESEISYAADDRNEISTPAALSVVEMRRTNTAPVNDAEGTTTQSILAADQFHCHVRVADIDGSSCSTETNTAKYHANSAAESFS